MKNVCVNMVDFSLLCLLASMNHSFLRWHAEKALKFLSLPRAHTYIHLKKSVTGLGVLCTWDFQTGQLFLQQFSLEEEMLLLEFITSGSI